MLLTQTLKPWPEAKLAFFEIVVPIILCLVGSVTYHTMMANHQHYHRWLFIDVCYLLLLPLDHLTASLASAGHLAAF